MIVAVNRLGPAARGFSVASASRADAHSSKKNGQHPQPPFPHQSRPCFRPIGTVRRLMAASASAFPRIKCGVRQRKHSSSSFRSQAMQPPPPEHGASARRPRLARPKTMEATMRVLSIKEPDADRTDRSAGPDHQRPAGHAGGLGQPANRAHQPAQHPQRSGAARSDAVTICKALPACTGRVRFTRAGGAAGYELFSRSPETCRGRRRKFLHRIRQGTRPREAIEKSPG